MRSRWIRLAVPVLLLASGLALASSGGPPASRTGAAATGSAPAEGNCTACHSGSALNSGGTLAILGVPAVYKPDSTYILTVQLASTQTSAASSRRWGFEITAVNASTGAGFGTLARTNADTTTTQILNGSGSFSTRRYLEQNGTGTRTGQASPVSWTLRWTAPNAAASTVSARFFAAGNAANGGGTSGGDFIYTASASSLPPARVTAAASLSYGTVIAGHGTWLMLQVGNTTPAPGDTLRCRLVAPRGFSAPRDEFTVSAGAAPHASMVWMEDANSGARSGDLAIVSNDPLAPTKFVALSGTVLDHSRPSLDSSAVATYDALGFGARNPGQFRDTTVRIFNLGFGATSARLYLSAATITGGAGRFTLPGGFTQQLVGASPASFSVRFADADARPDTTFTARLTFSCADEALPGGIERHSLAVTLSARVGTGVVGVEPGVAPLASRLLPVRPNPAVGRAWLGFDLVRSGAVALELYDMNGRRVKSIVRATLDPGRHTFEWNGADDRGSPLPAGVYVVRFSAPGLTASQRVALVR